MTLKDIADKLKGFLSQPIGNIQQGITNWATQNPQQARQITNFQQSIPSYPQQVQQNFQRMNPINMFTQVAAPYAQNRVVNPLLQGIKDIGGAWSLQALQQPLNPMRAVDLGKGLLNIGQAAFNLTPGGLGFAAYDYAKAAKQANLQGKGPLESMQAGKQGFTGEKTVGLGEALTANQKAQQFLNIAELPLMIATTHRLGGKERVLSTSKENVVKARDMLARQLGAIEGDVNKKYTSDQIDTAVKNLAGMNINIAKDAFQETAIKLSNFIQVAEKGLLVNKPIVGLGTRAVREEKKVIPPNLQPLAQEARKYKSAEEIRRKVETMLPDAKPNEANYISPAGKFKSNLGKDHNETASKLLGDNTLGKDNIRPLLESGTIRIDFRNNELSINIGAKPTEAQLKAIQSEFLDYGGYWKNKVFIDIEKGDKILASTRFNPTEYKPNEPIKFITDFYTQATKGVPQNIAVWYREPTGMGDFRLIKKGEFKNIEKAQDYIQEVKKAGGSWKLYQIRDLAGKPLVQATKGVGGVTQFSKTRTVPTQVAIKGKTMQLPQLRQGLKPNVPLRSPGLNEEALFQTQPKQTVKIQDRGLKKDLPEENLFQKSEKVRQEGIKQDKLDQSVPSLPDIVRRGDINVKSKVNIIDQYLRTPDRVLKKIGLENEGRVLRTQYEKYIKELPEEINKITQWSKQVPSESNVRIFNYLDGKKVELTPQELEVANEIQTYLSDWATKLKLPKDKTISHYITHIFEKDFIKKEFDPDLAKIIQDKIPGSVYDPFLEKRLGKKGYVQDTWRALDAYVKRATRKYNMDPALELIKNKSEGLELSQFNYVKKYIDRVNMRPTETDNLLDNTIKQIFGYGFGQRPTAYLTQKGRQMVYRGTVGLSPGTAIKNLTQGANTYAKLGERYTITGYLKNLIKIASGDKELERVGILRDNFIQDRSLNATKKMWEKLDKGLFFLFETAEKINRGSAYFGAKAKALDQGMNEQQAIEYAKKIVRDTQFTFGSIDTPPVLSSDIAKLLLQFQSFTLKQGEFLGEMIQHRELAGLLRYALASTIMAATVGKVIGMEWKDFIPSLRFGLPPTLQAPVEVGKALLGVPDKYGNPPDVKKILIKQVTPFLPGGVQIKKTYEGLEDVGKGYSETDKGRIKYPVEQTPINYLRGALFGRYNLDESQNYFDKKRSVLGPNQSEEFKSLQGQDRTDFYNFTIQERETNKLLDQIDKGIEEGKDVNSLIGQVQAVEESQNPYIQKRIQETKERIAKKIVERTNQPRNVGTNYIYPDPISGKAKVIDTSFQPTQPALTGQTEIDKLAISKYYSEITKKATNIYDLYKQSQLTLDQANTQLAELKTLKAKYAAPKKISIKISKPKKIKTIKIKLPKATKVKPIKIKRLTFKSPKYKGIKLTVK